MTDYYVEVYTAIHTMIHGRQPRQRHHCLDVVATTISRHCRCSARRYANVGVVPVPLPWRAATFTAAVAAIDPAAAAPTELYLYF